MKMLRGSEGFSGDIAGKMMVKMVAWMYRWESVRECEMSVCICEKMKKKTRVGDPCWLAKREKRDSVKMSGGEWWVGGWVGTCGTLRASTSVRLNFLFILHEKTYFFYFTHPLLQNTYISLSILHIYSIKYSLFYNFLLFTPSPPLSLSQTHSYHHHPATITTIITT